MFLSQHPKFCKVLEPNEKLDQKGKGAGNKRTTQVGDKVAGGKPSSVLTGIERPKGCDSAKKE